MYRTVSLFILLFLWRTESIAQIAGGQLGLDKVIPPSPEAASLAKYGQIPVSLNTGTINVDVPIYTISMGAFQLPVSLSYHGSGVKVEDIATSAGLGWTLNAGGMITRTVMGQADDMNGNGTVTGGYLVNSNPYVDKNAANIQSTQEDLFFLRFVAKDRVVDTEPDLFFYNFGSNAGKFLFNRQKQAMTIPYSDLKIEYSIAGGQIQYFRVTDDMGMIYEFNEVGYTDTFFRRYIEETNSANLLTQTEIFNGATSWSLTRIISPSLKDTIKFIYGSQDCYLRTEIPEFYAEDGYKMSAEGEEMTAYFSKGRFPRSMQSSRTGQKLITEIIFPNGKVLFDYAYDRTDLSSGMYGDGYMGRLSGATVLALSNSGSNYVPIKKFSFVHDYFVSAGGTYPYKNYRLRLKEVVENDKNNLKVGSHKFEYQEGLPPRSSYAQDIWGYYNGQNNNTGLLPRQMISSYIYPGTVEEIGSANREPAAGFMNAGMLSKVTYPTGGASEFIFEPNQYQTEEREMSSKVEKLEVLTGSSGPRATLVFTNNTPTHAGQITVYISKFSDKMADRSPYVSIRDLTVNNGTTFFQSNDSTRNYNISVPFSFVEGHQYELFIYTHAGTLPGVTVQVMASHNEKIDTIKKTRILGGLRIASITHYDNNGPGLKEIYKYGKNESGFGTPIIDLFSLTLTKRPVTFVYGKPLFSGGGAGNCIYIGKGGMQYYTTPNVPLSTLNGSLMGYEEVTKYYVDAVNPLRNVGKESFFYLVVPDHVYGIPGETGLYAVDAKPWMNGLLLGSTKYNYADSGGESQTIAYNTLTTTNINVLKVNMRDISLGGCTPIDSRGDYQVYNYSLSMGLMQPVKVTNATFAPVDDSHASYRGITTTETYQYSNLTHFKPTKYAITTSKGDSVESFMLYPDDMVKAGKDNDGVYSKMRVKNIIGVNVETKQLRNGKMLKESKTKFKDWFYDGNVLAPESIQRITDNNLSIPEKIVYHGYDRKGNPVSMSKEKDVIKSYVYDYNGMLPIAEVTNASQNDIAYTSFETLQTGNWEMPVVAKDTINSITGVSSIDLLKVGSTGITKSGLTTAVEYKLSYWTKNSQAFSIAGTQGSPVKGRSLNGWTYFEHRISGLSMLKITGSGLIDELRLYPATAQMGTYTYNPLYGMTSGCDAGNRITYYEYDAKGKLYLTRDLDGKILKQYDYQYQVPVQQ